MTNFATQAGSCGQNVPEGLGMFDIDLLLLTSSVLLLLLLPVHPCPPPTL
jgi:hypothetical protein